MKPKPRDILNEILMTRSSRPELAALVVEGESDCRFFRPRLDEKICKAWPAQGKPVARKLMEIVVEEKYPGILAIVDPDYDRLLERLKSHPGIIYYDENDFETMIICSSSFDESMREYLTAEDLAPILQRTGFATLRELVLDSAGRIGLLRFLSAKHNWNLSFKELREDGEKKKEGGFERFVEASTLAIDVDKLLRVVLNASNRTDVNYEKAREVYGKAIEETPSCAKYSNGHDATALLAFGIMRGDWTSGNRHTADDEITHSLIKDYSDFEETEAFSALQNWEVSNSPYRVITSRF